MEIFIGNVTFGLQEKQLRRHLKGPLSTFGVRAFHIQIVPKKGIAFLTVPVAEQGQQFLQIYGMPVQQQRNRRGPPPLPRKQINIHNRTLKFNQSNKHPNAYDKSLIKSLEREQREFAVAEARMGEDDKKKRVFNILGFEVGTWSLEEVEPSHVFLSCYKKNHFGRFHFGKHATGMTVYIDRPGNGDNGKMKISYNSLASIVVGQEGDHPTITLTMGYAPKFYRIPPQIDELILSFAGLSLDPAQKEAQMMQRVPHLDVVPNSFEHEMVAPFCFVYRFTLSSADDLHHIVRLGGSDGIPQMARIQTVSKNHLDSFKSEFVRMLTLISPSTSLGITYRISFQLTSLFANGILPPEKITALLPEVLALSNKIGADSTALVLRTFQDELGGTIPDPTYQKSPVTDSYLAKLLNEISRRRDTDLARTEAERTNNGQLAFIHSAIVTPAGLYFEGPRAEEANRVLRRYVDYQDYFLRVTFQDDDDDMINNERNVSLGPIYQRIKNYMSPFSEEGSINVGDRKFTFLGFSGAGLRCRSVWFMAPFVRRDGVYMDANRVIGELGDFSAIRNPGKYAARIGQAFSNTTASIEIPIEAERLIPDVETTEFVRDPKTDLVVGYKRVFSDGCGTISNQMLKRIWEKSDFYKEKRPTVFQIRYRGCFPTFAFLRSMLINNAQVQRVLFHSILH